MMKAACHLKLPKANANRYNKKLETYMRRMLKEAIREWLNATVREVVPTWSGASRATFEKIAALADTTIEYGPQKSNKDRRPLGRQESEAELSVQTSSGKFSFKWGTGLRYFILNNFTTQVYDPNAVDTGSGKIYYPSGLRNPGPYRLEEKGKAAIETFGSNISLPNPMEAVILKPIKVS